MKRKKFSVRVRKTSVLETTFEVEALSRGHGKSVALGDQHHLPPEEWTTCSELEVAVVHIEEVGTGSEEAVT